MYKGKKINRGYRSGLENKVNEQLKKEGVTFSYETLKIEWEDLAYRKYTPDFILTNGIIIETKGLFTASDRRKHLLIQKQHPELDIRFVFTNENSRLNKKSKTTYGNWCEKYNFKYATKIVPIEWTTETNKVLGFNVSKFIKFKGDKKC
tara:strand:+ start:90 stop:536 length:447 start_codon:yes stop_codon:yes gene_type:complete